MPAVANGQTLNIILSATSNMNTRRPIWKIKKNNLHILSQIEFNRRKILSVDYFFKVSNEMLKGSYITEYFF